MAFLLHMLAVISMTIPSVLGYNLIFGKGKVLHFGPIAVSIVAAYGTFACIRLGATYPVAILVGLILTLIVSFLFARLSLRLDGDAFGILSIALHLAFLTVVINSTNTTGGTLGITGIPRLAIIDTPARFVATVVCIAVFWIIVFWRLHQSAFGRRMTALAEHDWHARALGISRARTHTTAFLIAGLAAASANVFYPQYLHLLHPSDYTFPFLIFFVMAVVAGKPGSVFGVTLSTILLTLLKEAIRFLPLPISMIGPMRLLLFGLILFAAVWWRRDALFPGQRTV